MTDQRPDEEVPRSDEEPQEGAEQDAAPASDRPKVALKAQIGRVTRRDT